MHNLKTEYHIRLLWQMRDPFHIVEWTRILVRLNKGIR